MADDEKLTTPLQVLVLAALCFDAGHGAAIAAQVRTDYFDTVYRDFATRVLAYRKRYGKPPGKIQLKEIINHLSFGKENTVVEKKLFPSLLAAEEGLNAEYIATRVDDYVRRQILKGAINDAMDRYTQDDEDMPDEVESIFHDALKSRQNTAGTGTFLNDLDAMRFLDRRFEGISLGIPELDMMRIGLVPKQHLLYIASKGKGKSWFCCHCGKQGLLQKWKVAHYTLEMPEEEVIPRYYQTMFGMAEQQDRYNRTILELDELGRYKGFKTKSTKTRLDFTQANIRKILRKKIGTFGTRFGNLVVKDYPTGSLTISQLTSHLDYLAEVEDFIPNLIIVDSPKLMKIDRANPRMSIGANMEELRGLAGVRNCALVTPHQGTRRTLLAKRVRSSDASEDISVIQTADVVLAFSQTEAEQRLGLARLSVEHARRTRGGGIILLTQAYEIGQYVLSSALIQNTYWDQLKESGGDDDEED